MQLRHHPFVIFNPLTSHRSFYRRLFSNRLKNCFFFFSGFDKQFTEILYLAPTSMGYKLQKIFPVPPPPMYGILEILLSLVLCIVLGLSKLVSKLLPKLGQALELFFKCMLLYIPAAILTVVFSPVIYLVHIYTKHRGRVLLNRIGELQVVAIEPVPNIPLDLNNGYYNDTNMKIHEKALIARYQEFCLQTIPLKDHKVSALIEQLNSEDCEQKFILRRIPKEWKEANAVNPTEYSEIFGLFPSTFYVNVPFPGYKVISGDCYARPLALIVPSKKNRHQFEAVVKYGIFSEYSLLSTCDTLNKGTEQEVLESLNKCDPYTPRFQCAIALLTLLRAQDAYLEDKTLSNSINPLLPIITDFAGLSTVFQDTQVGNESLRQFNTDLNSMIELNVGAKTR